jgi:DNA polymerase
MLRANLTTRGAAVAAEPQARLDAIARDLFGHLPCPSEPCATCTQLVPGTGSATAEVVIVGEAPGAAEDLSGLPFVGNAGKLLDRLLEEAGLGRADAFVTNVVKARPPGNRDPSAAEVAHHWPWLQAQLDVLQPRLIVPLGRHALGRFAPRSDRISAVHGRVLERDGRRLFPLYHPAAALHNPGLRTTLSIDARALGETLRAENRKADPAGVSGAGAGNAPTMDERELFTEHFDSDPEAVWSALKRAAATMELHEADDATKTARLSTGVSLTNWGEHLVATVAPAAPGADLVVRGRPKGSLLTTKWGEDIHAREVQKDLRTAVKNALVA